MKIDGVNLIHNSALQDAVVESGTTLPTANAQDDGRLFFLTQPQGQNPKGLYVYSDSDTEWQFTNDNSDVQNIADNFFDTNGSRLTILNNNQGQDFDLSVTDTEGTVYPGISIIGNTSQPYVNLNFDGVAKLTTRVNGVEVFGSITTDSGSVYTTGDFSLTSNPQDATQDAVTKVADFGIGFDGTNTLSLAQLNVGTDLNDSKTTGVYRINSGSVANLAPGVTSGSSLIVTCFDTNDVQQLILPRQINDKVQVRCLTAGIWSDWAPLVAQGDFGLGGGLIGDNIQDLNSVDKSGFFLTDNVGLSNLPPNAPETRYMLLHGGDTSTTYAYQYLMDAGQGLGSSNRIWYRRMRNTGVFSDWVELLHDGDINFTQYGTGGENEVIAIGTATTATELRLYLPLQSYTKPVSVNVTSTFSIRELDSTPTGNTNVDSADIGYSSTISSGNMVVLIITNVSGLIPGNQYRLQTNTTTSQIKIML